MRFLYQQLRPTRTTGVKHIIGDVKLAILLELHTQVAAVCVTSSVRRALRYRSSVHRRLYTGWPGRNVPDFGRMFLKLKYADITQNTYIRS